MFCVKIKVACYILLYLNAALQRKTGVVLSKYYAVKGNGEKHLFTDWDACKEFTAGKKGYKFKSFSTKEEAEFYLEDKDYAENAVAEDLKNGYAVAYTDGSFEESAGAYSFGALVFSPDGGKASFCDSGKNPDFISSRNVAGEVLGVIESVKWAFLNGYDKLKIYHDYEGLSAWATGLWQARGAVSLYYVERLKRYSDAVKITFEKVKGHSNNSYNEAVDKLAKAALFDGKREVVSGIGCKISGVGEYESLCEYIYRQVKGVKTELGDDYCKFENRGKKIAVYRKSGCLSVCGDNGLLYLTAAGFFYRCCTKGGVNRLIERFFDVETNGEFGSGADVTEFLAKNVRAQNYAPYIVFALIDAEMRISGVLASKGFAGEKISRAFVKKNGEFKTVLPFNGAEKIEESYSFFYNYRTKLDDLVFSQKECLDFCAEAKKY